MDTCCLKRPYDDQTQSRIRAETEAIQIIQDAIENSRFTWSGSEILNYENSRNPDSDRRERVNAVIGQVSEVVELTDAIEQRASSLRIPWLCGSGRASPRKRGISEGFSFVDV